MRPKARPKCNRAFILPTSLTLITVSSRFAHLLEIHINESEVALDGPVDPGSAFKTDARGRKSRKHLKILYRKHLNCGETVISSPAGIVQTNALVLTGLANFSVVGY